MEMSEVEYFHGVHVGHEEKHGEQNNNLAGNGFHGGEMSMEDAGPSPRFPVSEFHSRSLALAVAQELWGELTDQA